MTALPHAGLLYSHLSLLPLPFPIIVSQIVEPHSNKPRSCRRTVTMVTSSTRARLDQVRYTRSIGHASSDARRSTFDVVLTLVSLAMVTTSQPHSPRRKHGKDAKRTRARYVTPDHI
ncbi:hypothetical protein BC629DRAFT_624970 [Irpex lacteus]|nr:hypothetical protein BC629DRAFT_624970 [Irpex lacteus]